MAFTIQGTTVVITPVQKDDGTKEVGKMSGAEVKQAAQQMGIQLLDGQIDEAAEYTEAEVNNMIMHYSTTRDALSTMMQKTSTGNKDQTIADLKAKYFVDGPGGADPYSMQNPQMTKFKEFLDSGEMAKLGESFNRNDIVDIINSVFPSVGISGGTGENDQFTVPWGHGDDARAVFKDALDQISSAAGSTPEIAALEAQLKAKTSELNKNLLTIKNLSTQANQLADEIKDEVDDAIQESKDIAEEYKTKAKQTVDKKITEYANSNGEMTFEQFQSGLGTALNSIDPSGKLSAVVKKMTSAENKMAGLTNIVKRIGNLNTKNATLRTEIGDINEQISIKKAEEAAKTKRTDPIGFTMADGSRVDFFIDRDENGDITNETEFLGAGTGWAEMTALNTNNDNKVDYNELKNTQGLKAIVTDKNGNQTVKNISDVMKDGDSIDLSSYKTNGMEIEGTNNILQGTFTANIGGKALEGYQTLDDINWLDDNYNFTDKTEGKGRFASGDVMAVEETEIMASDFDSLISELENKLETGWNKIGIERSTIKDKIQGAYDTAAKNKAAAIRNSFIGKGGTTEATEATEPTKPTKATNPTTETIDTYTPSTPSTPTEPEYDEYNENDWPYINLKLSDELSMSACDRLRQNLIDKLKQGNYSPADKKEIIRQIDLAYEQALFIHHREDPQTASTKWDAHVKEQKGIADSADIEYKLTKYAYA